MTFKAAKCPNCSGELMLDPSKKSGFCNYCGSEIIVKEAISKVQIDQQPQVESLLKLGQDAYDRGDSKEAYDYYSKVLEIDPTQWKAFWYRGISGAWQSSLANIRLIDAIQGSSKALAILSDKVTNSLPENQAVESIELKNQKVIMAYEIYKITKILHDKAKKHYEEFSSAENAFKQYWDRYHYHFIPALEYCLTLVEDEILDSEIESLADDAVTLELAQQIKKTVNAFKPKLLQEGLDYCMVVKKNTQKMIDAYKADGLENPYIRFSNAMKKINPSHEIKIEKEGPIEKEGSCYIATAVYGNHNAPQVIFLRQYRDEVLLQSHTGRLFIKVYYNFSSGFANWIANRGYINLFIRKVLDAVIMILKKYR